MPVAWPIDGHILITFLAMAKGVTMQKNDPVIVMVAMATGYTPIRILKLVSVVKAG